MEKRKSRMKEGAMSQMAIVQEDCDLKDVQLPSENELDPVIKLEEVIDR